MTNTSNIPKRFCKPCRNCNHKKEAVRKDSLFFVFNANSKLIDLYFIKKRGFRITLKTLYNSVILYKTKQTDFFYPFGKIMGNSNQSKFDIDFS